MDEVDHCESKEINIKIIDINIDIINIKIIEDTMH